MSAVRRSLRKWRAAELNEKGESREGISPPRAPKTVREPLDLHGFRCSASDVH